MLRRTLLIALILFTSSFSYAAEPKAAAEKKAPKKSEQNVRELLPTDIVMGKDDAPVLLIEYASLTCPHCASFHNGTFPVIKERYIDTGKVRYVFRSFPLDEAALRATMLTQCVDKEQYYKVIGVLFKTQGNWGTKQDYMSILENIGKLSGLSGADFEKCTTDKTREAKIVETKIQAADQLSIQATPSFVLEGELISGAKPTEFFEKALDDAYLKETMTNEKKPAKPVVEKAGKPAENKGN